LLQQGHQVIRVVAPTGIGNETEYWGPSLRTVAQEHGLIVLTDRDLYTELADAKAQDRLGGIDLVVSFLFWKRIKSPIIECARFGCVNFHPAPLPEYRGLGGFNFAILHRLTEWGVTAHYIDETIDTGPIIRVDRFPFDWREVTAYSLELATRPALLECFKNTIADVARCGQLRTTPNVGGKYFTRKDFEKEKHLDLDAMTADEIDLRARAFWYPPDDGAYIEKDGQRFTLAPRAVLDELTVLHQTCPPSWQREGHEMS
jgi:methionyl-tRNA formyltransferase